MKRTILSVALLSIAALSQALDTNNVCINVNAGAPIAKMRPLWSFVGYDEPNYTYMDDGKELLSRIAAANLAPVNVRVHNLLTTGNGEASLKWGSTNAYNEDKDGKPVYNWIITDSIFDTFVSMGMRPLVQIGFMPEALSTNPVPYRHNWSPSDPYSAIFTGWAYPPNDYDKWRELIYQWALHCKERYGENQVSQWYWEVWNEPNLYLQGSLEDYCKMYDYAADGLLRAIPEAIIGGPHTTGPRNRHAAQYLRDFLKHCLYGTNYATGRIGSPLRYVGYHAKGNPRFYDNDGKKSIMMSLGAQLADVAAGFSVVNEFPDLKDIPIIIGEFDPEGCAACSTDFNPQFDYRNGTLYSSTVAASYGRLQALASQHDTNLVGAVTWAFEFENQPWFAGFRDLYTNGVDKPVLNVFRMLGQMSGDLLEATSTHMASTDSLIAHGIGANNDIGVLASGDGNCVYILVWNYSDLDDLKVPASPVDLNISGLHGDRVYVEHFRVDQDHSNSFGLWCEMGRPEDPDKEQIQQLFRAGQLQMLNSPAWMDTDHGKLAIDFNLPPQGVSLLRISAPAVDSDGVIGQGKGIFPGRVTWIRDLDATRWNGRDGHWWDEASIDQTALNSMFDRSLCALTGSDTSAESWDKIFRYYNANHGKGDTGYIPGETIAVKINLNNTYDANDTDNDIDQSIHNTRALIKQLVEHAGVRQKDIIIYDATIGWRVRALPHRLYDPLHREFPGVRWMSANGGEGIESADWVENAISYTNPAVKLGNALPRAVVEADYLINAALLKGHEMTGVTLGAKNHFGSIQFPPREHGSTFVHQMMGQQGDYSALVDLMGSKNLGAKTILYIVDGLYGMQTNVGAPHPGRDVWTTLPGGGYWCASLFMSLDPVAIESVCLDFLVAEYGGELGFSGAPQFPKGAVNNCDNYLREAASGINSQFGPYRPDGHPIGSLGVFEHWDNPFDRQYSRNRGLNRGIELITLKPAKK